HHPRRRQHGRDHHAAGGGRCRRAPLRDRARDRPQGDVTRRWCSVYGRVRGGGRAVPARLPLLVHRGPADRRRRRGRRRESDHDRHLRGRDPHCDVRGHHGARTDGPRPDAHARGALSLFNIVSTFVIAAGFLVVAVIVGNLIAPRLFRLIDSMQVRGVLLVSAFAFALIFAALAGLAGSAMIIGAFAAGIVLSSTNQFDVITERVKPVADIFTPIFFVSVGAGV